jgi:hypothetical protein
MVKRRIGVVQAGERETSLMSLQNKAASICLFILLSACAFAQTVTGSLVGTVVDPAGSVIPGAQVQLTNQGTAAIITATGDNAGLFRFPNLNPADYMVTVRAKGFKTRVEKDISVGLSENRDLGRLELEIGNVTDSVTVTAEVTPVQTSSSERSSVIEGSQLNTEAIRGREMMSYMRMLPGVVDTTVARDATGGSVLGGLTFNGSTGLTGFMVDGIADMDTGCSNCFTHFEPNIDAIGEVKVLTSNYQAEFGRNAGGAISVVTKSGTQEFHGSGWWTHRHEDLNANDFFNNVTGLPRSRYRFNIAGWSLGGPVFIPKHFNTSKTKIFFFASQEYTQQLVNSSNQYKSMPTALERAGNFSQSVNGSGQLITLTDPLTGAPFPGNIIPQSRINGWGQAMLNFFPLPNTAFAQGTAQYLQDNFQSAGSAPHPRRNDIARVDFNLTSKLNAYLRYGHDADDWTEIYQSSQFLVGPTGNITQDHPAPGHGILASGNYVFSPTLVNQFTYSKTLNHWSWFEVDPPAVERSVLNGTAGTPQAGQPLPSLFPLHTVGPGVGGSALAEGPDDASNGYSNYMPGLSFGSTPPGTASYTNGNPEYSNNNVIDTVTDNLSKVWGQHSLKTGIYVEFNRKIQPCGSAGCNGYTGSYSFAPDANNPLNTGDGYANALLGYYDTYSEATAKVIVDDTFWNVEFYVQDNWRITKRLTLDLGLRFYHQSPEVDNERQFAYFSAAAYNPATAPRYYVPAIVGGKRVGEDPVTGAVVGVGEIGLFVPNSGNPADGMVVAGENGVPLNTYNTTPLAFAPRLGFAYDLFGNGKTAIRGGVGVFYDRLDGNEVYSMASNPPSIYTPTAYYGQISQLSGAGGLLGPTTITQWSGHTRLPQVRSASFGVQQNVGFGTVLDVSYQGTFGLNRNEYENMNAIPIGADFLPQNIDPTQTGNKPLPAALERTIYPSIGTLNEFVFDGKSSYNGLQATLRKRLSRGLQFGISYAWSRAMGLTTFDPLVANNYSRNYGPQSIDRRQTLGVSYSYDFPKPGQALHSKLLSVVADGWQVSGITTANSGAPYTPSFTTTNGEDITGSTNESPRINVVGNPFANVPTNSSLPNGGLAFNPAAFALPAVGTIGNAGTNIMYGPGFLNFDASLSRWIPVGSEKRRFNLRLEAFNVFNHVEFSGVNSSFTFNPATGLNTNASTGQYTSDRGPRILSLELRFQF